MNEKEKDLLIKDLCARLPYGVKAHIKNWSNLDRKYYEGVYTIESIDTSLNTIIADSERGCVEVIVGYVDYEIKPYLFPMSSMTIEQKIKWIRTLSSDYNITYDTVDWLNKNHFDYRGLIPMGLALDATNLNIY